MYLKRLEISGFKSFADKSTLEFKRGISAIVGPNGSGKSNIADAVRWVMGEQGMKSLRSKKSEDLIFSGSTQRGPSNKASVSMVFDNSDRAFPMEFEEINVTRKVFRSGESQYSINDSQVRLKDVLELIAKARLGLRGYTIINQGMGDFILNASPMQRREIFEDALGLKEYQLKKIEAKNKLEQTRNNLSQTRTLIAEIGPHLKFLKRQAEKIQQKEELEKTLKDAEKKYFGIKLAYLAKEKAQIADIKIKGDNEAQSCQKDILILKEFIEKNERELEDFFDQESGLEKGVEKILQEKSILERELGKIEGMLAYQKESPREIFELVDLNYLSKSIEDIYTHSKALLALNSIEEIRGEMAEIVKKFENILKDIKEGKIKKMQEPEKKSDEKSDLPEQKNKLNSLLSGIDDKLKELKIKIRDLNVAHREQKDKLYSSKKDLYEKESRCENLFRQLADIDLRAEKIDSEINIVKIESGTNHEESIVPSESEKESSNHNPDLLKNEIDKIKMRLEMTENIDPEIQKEYEETQKRFDFLTRESEDLDKAIESLKGIILSLEEKIKQLFSESFEKINSEFNRYFNILFEGGKARLAEISAEKISSDEETEETEKSNENQDGGIEIMVDMPRKKIKDIHLLSGGERTLTSIALIFALVSSSPPPFLIIDEIDAPLDESNALRFGRILEELRAKTQFVVITHNRETMKQADVLYGITMGEEGVSKLFSLKLEQVPESSPEK